MRILKDIVKKRVNPAPNLQITINKLFANRTNTHTSKAVLI